MDMQRREQLIFQIRQQELAGLSKALPVVSLADFFIGNDDFGSIGCNLLDSPGPQAFFQILGAIRARPNVQDVLVEIMEVEQDEWPFSERVYILANASLSEVESWVKPLEADDVAEGYEFGTPACTPLLEPNIKVFSVWWD